ncbi:hypothetical protein QA646_06000 [Rhizobium sp. CB3090]|uniref:hypothetical protein n=1 Tax=Rhizobium sp. CB3090 TaxID=3039156 RepID=UPI0024B0F0B1|nr:hypothetical protein [Rhizobium sp. CB3090]WFU10406.1 hypothetical protein QA646_06000 [Rhizobium sp. CB3090]
MGPSDFQTADIHSLYHESAAGDSYGYRVEPCAILLFLSGIGMKAVKRRQWARASVLEWHHQNAEQMLWIKGMERPLRVQSDAAL